MRFSLVTVAVLTALLTTPALAHQCPSLMAEIDQALPSANLSNADLRRVQQLRRQGEELHAAGNHDASEAALHEAMKLLGI